MWLVGFGGVGFPVSGPEELGALGTRAPPPTPTPTPIFANI